MASDTETGQTGQEPQDMLTGVGEWRKRCLAAEQERDQAQAEVERLTRDLDHVNKSYKNALDFQGEAQEYLIALREDNDRLRAGIDAICDLYKTAWRTEAIRNRLQSLLTPAPAPVHNHGPEEGPGLLCPERRLPDGALRGACMVDEGDETQS